MEFNSDVEEFRRLCRECWNFPEPIEASRRFDELYGPKIEYWTRLCFPGVSEHDNQVLRRFIRRRVIDVGTKSELPPGKVIALVAMETRHAMRDVGRPLR